MIPSSGSGKTIRMISEPQIPFGSGSDTSRVTVVYAPIAFCILIVLYVSVPVGHPGRWAIYVTPLLVMFELLARRSLIVNGNVLALLGLYIFYGTILSLGVDELSFVIKDMIFISLPIFLLSLRFEVHWSFPYAMEQTFRSAVLDQYNAFQIIFGGGPGSSTRFLDHYAQFIDTSFPMLHNDYLRILSEYGIVGVFVTIAFAFKALTLGPLARLLTLYACICFLTDNVLTYSFFWFVFIFCLRWQAQPKLSVLQR